MKPLPKITPLTRPFWEGCRRGELRLQRCAGCGAFRFFPTESCHHCGSVQYTWEATTRRGTLYSWLVVRRPVDDSWAADVPFAIAVVALDVPGKPLLTGTLVGCPLDEIQADLWVTAEFDVINDEVSLLRWRPESR